MGEGASANGRRGECGVGRGHAYTHCRLNQRLALQIALRRLKLLEKTSKGRDGEEEGEGVIGRGQKHAGQRRGVDSLQTQRLALQVALHQLKLLHRPQAARLVEAKARLVGEQPDALWGAGAVLGALDRDRLQLDGCKANQAVNGSARKTHSELGS